jgi:negative regulator of flagellin synthesis FlgM
MLISNLNGQERLAAAMPLTAVRRAGPTYATQGASAPTRQSDAVSLSDAARALASARTTVADATDVRADRVAALKSAIADGTYKIDGRALAKSMVRAGAFGR